MLLRMVLDSIQTQVPKAPMVFSHRACVPSCLLMCIVGEMYADASDPDAEGSGQDAAA